MEPFEFEEKPIQLIYLTPSGKYEMGPTAKSFLSKIQKPLSIISIAGLCKSGKSYLLNRVLLNKNNGFRVGPTINPCTEGLWCWGVPLEGTNTDGQRVNILVVDSEGFGSRDKDQIHDTKMLTFSILTSSILIFNSVGLIDETALLNLSLIANLTNNLELNTSSSQEDDPKEIAKYFPDFYWVLRDFTLQLVSQGEQLTPKKYLQKALAPQKESSNDVVQSNRIKGLFTSFFKKRQCETLVRPLLNENKLQRLDDCSFEDLRPKFVEQALNLRKKVLTNAKPKMFRGQCLDGAMYVSMISSYLDAIKNAGVPNIQNVWMKICLNCISRNQNLLKKQNQELRQQLKIAQRQSKNKSNNYDLLQRKFNVLSQQLKLKEVAKQTYFKGLKDLTDDYQKECSKFSNQRKVSVKENTNISTLIEKKNYPAQKESIKQVQALIENQNKFLLEKISNRKKMSYKKQQEKQIDYTVCKTLIDQITDLQNQASQKKIELNKLLNDD